MGHHHDHSHTHNIDVKNVNRAFIVGIVLNSLFVVIEFISGILYDSMALVSDAGHNLVDVISLTLALLAIKMAKIKSNDKLTYGYRKMTILASLTNSVLLFIAIGFIIKETIERIIEPVHVEGKAIVIIATIGLIINAFTAYLFIKDKEKDINIKGAYLHLAADALVSLGVVISGIVIMYTGWYMLDTIISIVIVIVIFFSTWHLFKDSINLSIDGVPNGINLSELQNELLNIKNIKGIHHLHVWGISTTENALTAHILIENDLTMTEIAKLKSNIKHELIHHKISHSTLEFEIEDEKCSDITSHDI